jgi:hypothetical protein
MNKRALFLSITAMILVAACAEKHAEPIDFANACKIENEKKYVQISGFLTDNGSVYCSNTGGRMDCGFDLTETPNAKKGLRADIAQGSGANSVEKFESSYKKEDIKIHDNSGSLVKLGEKVKLTGTMNVMPDGSFCFLVVDKIEK